VLLAEVDADPLAPPPRETPPDIEGTLILTFKPPEALPEALPEFEALVDVDPLVEPDVLVLTEAFGTAILPEADPVADPFPVAEAVVLGLVTMAWILLDFF